MTPQEKDRIECAIRHIQTAVDVDPWAVEIAVEAMRKQIPKKPNKANGVYFCTVCGASVEGCKDICFRCGQAIDWEKER